MSIFLFFVSILALISVAVYEIVCIQTGYDVTQSYYTALFSTTIGTLSSQLSRCSYAQISTTNTASFNLKCGVGEILVGVPVLTVETLSSIVNCRKERAKADYQTYIPDYAMISTNSSTTEANVSILINSAVYNATSYSYIAYNFQCRKSVYKLSTLSVPEQAFLYVVVGIDLGIIVFFMFFLISEHKAETEET